MKHLNKTVIHITVYKQTNKGYIFFVLCIKQLRSLKNKSKFLDTNKWKRVWRGEKSEGARKRRSDANIIFDHVSCVCIMSSFQIPVNNKFFLNVFCVLQVKGYWSFKIAQFVFVFKFLFDFEKLNWKFIEYFFLLF